MADLIDQAQDAEAAHRDAALRGRRLHGHHFADQDGTIRPRDCVDCGEPIPSARLAAAPEATRCAFCQSEVEQHGGP